MPTFESVQLLAHSFPEVTEEPHFDKTALKVKKKIFCTHNPAFQRICVKLSIVDQDVFCTSDSKSIYPVPNNFGKQGWTLIQLETVHPDLLKDALTTAYCHVAPKKLAVQVRPLDTNAEESF